MNQRPTAIKEAIATPIPMPNDRGVFVHGVPAEKCAPKHMRMHDLLRANERLRKNGDAPLRSLLSSGK